MSTLSLYLIVKILFQSIFYITIFGIIIVYILLFFIKNNNNNKDIFIKSISIHKYLIYYLQYLFIISFLLFTIIFIIYIQIININNNLLIYSYNLILPTINFHISVYNLFFNYYNSINLYFTFDLFGFILLLLAYLVGLISYFVLDTRIYEKNINFFLSFHLFILIVYLFVSTSNIIIFFLTYELLLLPSFLFVYFISPSRRALQASLYFVIWTQIGSVLVMIALIILITNVQLFDFFLIKNQQIDSINYYVIIILLFLGFGFKVPIWPFHYWLTKTHVEAPSGFSIYLSGFLVKSALFGYYKLINLFNIEYNSSLFLMICIIGIIDSSLKMWGQTDVKKLVAYGTVQEMNIIFLVFNLGDINAIIIGILFSATHAFLSALMFFLVDCFYRRYHTRSISEVNGILHLTPNLAILIIFMIIFFSGLPGTLKFTCEFYIFSGFILLSPLISIIIIIIANVIGLIGFSKVWFNLIFGINRNYYNSIIIDLTKKEIFILLFCFFFLFICSFFPIFLF
mgnify:CR=1 FL=1